MKRGRAFGLDLCGSFDAPGLLTAPADSAEPGSTLLLLASPEAIGPGGGEPVYRQPLATGELSIARDDDGSFQLEHTYYGRFRVSADAAEIVCAPEPLPEWLWQRFLVGQVLPLAALLKGYETLHASAVVVDGAARVILGTSGAGKTCVALQMAAGGAQVLADDVVALGIERAAVVAHPGPALASVTGDDLAQLPPEWRAHVTPLGTSEGETRIALGGMAPGAAPVAEVYVLTQRAEGTELAVTRAEQAPAILLGGTFNAYLREPARLRRQLEITARLAENAPIHVVTIPPDTSAATVAATLLQR